jgi:hypothetical protein
MLTPFASAQGLAPPKPPVSGTRWKAGPGGKCLIQTSVRRSAACEAKRSRTTPNSSCNAVGRNAVERSETACRPMRAPAQVNRVTQAPPRWGSGWQDARANSVERENHLDLGNLLNEATPCSTPIIYRPGNHLSTPSHACIHERLDHEERGRSRCCPHWLPGTHGGGIEPDPE